MQMNNLKNRYIALRHGESKANVAELIVSNLADAINEDYSLTKNGEHQVKDLVTHALKNNLLSNSTIIYSSPFSRCKKTAEIAKYVLGVDGEVKVDDRLKERWFGNFDKTSAINYEKVWNNDKQNDKLKNNEESVDSVKERVNSLIMDLEKEYEGNTFLLVSHGDVLQILETQFLNMLASQHREIKPLKRGEIRELNK